MDLESWLEASKKCFSASFFFLWAGIKAPTRSGGLSGELWHTHRGRAREQLSLQPYVTLPVVTQLPECDSGTDKGHLLTSKENY